MLEKFSANRQRKKVHQRIRKTLIGTDARPRLSVYRSLNHLYAQLIDDRSGRTLVSASTLEKEEKKSTRRGGNIAAAKAVGKMIAERARSKGIETVVFDRSGYIYHGRVKALAEAARQAGLKF
ncbi:MAG TPA: 50S ribosomal protein L18 [Acidobacteriota bacterium]|jgi:large subunit ribosomal protein L18|nr:50S ribosomal protein L18 [Acidobacteriota bacterium]